MAEKDSCVCSRGADKEQCVARVMHIMWEAANKVAFVSYLRVSEGSMTEQDGEVTQRCTWNTDIRAMWTMCVHSTSA